MFRSFFFPTQSMLGASISLNRPEYSLNSPRHAFRFLILGAGIHGVYLANLLLEVGKVDPGRIALVDQRSSLLGEWMKVTAATGMTHLRSTSVHHLDPEPVSLRNYYSEHRSDYPRAYASPYNRPSLALFNDHARWSARRSGAAGSLRVGEVREIRPVDGGYRLVTPNASYEGDNLILAPGQGELRFPAWSEDLGNETRPVHLFSDEFDLGHWQRRAAEGESVKIVGAGISALQVAVSIAAGATVPVEVFSLHEPRTRQFDSDPGWIGPRYLQRFSAERNPESRRRILNNARYPGSGDAETVKRFLRMVDSGRIRFVTGDEETLSFRLKDALVRDGGRLLVATGYKGRRPGGRMVDELIQRAELPTADCGFPVLNPYLAWAPGLFVSGALGELELGPVARNITGARRAGERLYRLMTASGEVAV